MISQTDIETFLKKRQALPVVDVRSPGEFAQGHIPGAVNIPLFDDEERKVVGTKYKQENRESAMFAALDFVGPKMSGLARAGMKIARNKELLIHCWRGGMRSSSMAWLFSTMGIHCHLLDGGYRAYRRYNREYISGEFELRVIGGSTGSGKTAILSELEAAGEQVIDLEGMAHHKGSAFGALGELPQPSTEQFENLLADALYRLHPGKRIWLEDESRNIGKCVIPEPFYFAMRRASLVVIEMERELRAGRLVEDYAAYPENELVACVEKISKRLGGDRTRDAVEAVLQKDFFRTAMITLEYYDKAYAFSLEKNHSGTRTTLTVTTADPALNARMILEAATSNSL